MPAIAAAASWMETLHMPMREIKQKYTKSELIIIAWRSQEMAYNMRKRVGRPPRTRERDEVQDTVRKAYKLKDNADAYDFEADDTGLEQRLGPVAKKLDESLNLGKLTGAEAQRYMQALGITIPVFHPVARKPKRS